MKKEQLVNLVEQMTLKEKVDQLLQLAADFYSEKAEAKTGPMAQLNITQDTVNHAGTTLGISGAKEAIRVQKTYMENNRLHIPTLLMADIIHGFRTIFPIPLGLGSSWDLQAAKQMAEVSAKEAAVSGLHVTFSPMVDLVRDPRWGRVMESTGEDPFLNARFAEAFVKGYQGDDLEHDFMRVAACVKHFAAYGAALAGRDYNTVNMSERQLRDQYLPGYKAALDAGAKLVMTSFNTVDGVPATGNEWLFRDVLRGEFGFDGVVISDWGAVQELIPHGVAKDQKEAARLAIQASVDIEMMTNCYTGYLEELITEGTVPEAMLDEAVLRILELKNDLGLFEHPYRGADEALEAQHVLSDEHRSIARDVARRSIVLLKNEHATLPLRKDQTLALVGPAAQSHDVLGVWSWQGKKEEAVTLAQGVQHYAKQVHTQTEAFDYFTPSKEAIEEAVSLAKEAEVVILALGEEDWMSGEASSQTDIRLPQAQLELFDKVRAVAKTLIVTLYNGRPLDLTAIQSADAIVEAWFPGTEAGNALADILFGVYNPSGRLSMSFPENVGQVPVFYNTDNTGRPYLGDPNEKYVSKYLDASNQPRYPFGYGLSYGEVTYSQTIVHQDTVQLGDTITVEATISNHSDYKRRETVQLYVRDIVGKVVRPVRELKGFTQIDLAPQESQTVRFELTTDQLFYVHSNQEWSTEPGEFHVWIAPNSQEGVKTSFTLV